MINKKLNLISLSLPIFIELFLQMSLSILDIFILSYFSDNAVGSVGMVSQLLSTLGLMYGIVSSGTVILVSQNLGAKKEEKALQIANIAINFNVLIGLVVAIFLHIFRLHLLKIMSFPEEFIYFGNQYLGIVGSFSFILSLLITLSAISRSFSFTKIAMFVGVGINLLNIIGDYISVFGFMRIPVLGVKGVAFATVISRGIGVMILLIILIKYKKLKISFTNNFFRSDYIKEILKIGIPSSGEKVSYIISQIFITAFIISRFGAIALTTKTYVLNITRIIEMLPIAIGIGAKIFIGYLVGANKNKEAYYKCLYGLKLGFIITVFLSILLVFFRKEFIGLFTNNEDIIFLGSKLILLSLILIPGKAINLIIGNCLRGTGDVKCPAYIGIVFMWICGVFLSYIFGVKYELSLVGVWIAYTIDEWIRGIILFSRWRSMYWVKKSLFNKNSFIQ